MPGIAVKGLDAAGGVQLGGGQDFLTIDGAPAVLLGDAVAGHPPWDTPHAYGPRMVQGSDAFTINGKPVCRAGHRASCGHATTGRPWFEIP